MGKLVIVGCARVGLLTTKHARFIVGDLVAHFGPYPHQNQADRVAPCSECRIIRRL